MTVPCSPHWTEVLESMALSLSAPQFSFSRTHTVTLKNVVWYHVQLWSQPVVDRNSCFLSLSTWWEQAQGDSKAGMTDWQGSHHHSSCQQEGRVTARLTSSLWTDQRHQQRALLLFWIIVFNAYSSLSETHIYANVLKRCTTGKPTTG